jgi:CDGSH-type Zn-finger protein
VLAGLVTSPAVPEQPRITPQPDGPYRVDGLERLLSSGGEQLAVRPALFLCRCGGSSNKPFCDGTHLKIGFRSRRESRRQIARRAAYSGAQITINDNRAICAHTGFCTDELERVFASGRKPWIDSDAATVDEIAATVRKCPSGALSYTLDGVEYAGDSGDATITVSKDGPYFVAGSIELVHPGPHGPSAVRFALCRCGQSSNKPFCDGTHWDAGFRDPTD